MRFLPALREKGESRAAQPSIYTLFTSMGGGESRRVVSVIYRKVWIHIEKGRKINIMPIGRQ